MNRRVVERRSVFMKTVLASGSYIVSPSNMNPRIRLKWALFKEMGLFIACDMFFIKKFFKVTGATNLSIYHANNKSESMIPSIIAFKFFLYIVICFRRLFLTG